MRKILLVTALLSLFGFVQTVIANEDNLPVYVNIGKETKAITFGSDKTARVNVQPDHTSTIVAVSLPPGSDKDILLPTCNNQHVTPSHSVNCPVSTSYPTELTLVNYNQLTNTQKGAVIGAASGIGLVLFSVGMSLLTGSTSLALGPAAATAGVVLLFYGGAGAGIGAAIGAAKSRQSNSRM